MEELVKQLLVRRAEEQNRMILRAGQGAQPYRAPDRANPMVEQGAKMGAAVQHPPATEREAQKAAEYKKHGYRWGTEALPAPTPPMMQEEADRKAAGTYPSGGYIMMENDGADAQPRAYTPNLQRGESLGELHGMAGDAMYRPTFDYMPRVNGLDKRSLDEAAAQDLVPGSWQDERHSGVAARPIGPLAPGMPDQMFMDATYAEGMANLAAQLRANRRRVMGIADPEFIKAQPLY